MKTRDEFAAAVEKAVRQYIDNSDIVDSNPQLMVNPASLEVMLINGCDMLSELEDSDEAIESAAGVDGSWDEDASDFQVRQNPDFYAVSKLVKQVSGGRTEPDKAAIKGIVDIYFR